MGSEKENSQLPPITRVSPEIPIIEVDEDDSLHEFWTTEWTEFNLPQYGANWRIILLSVVRSDGILEWALLREYEDHSKEVISHMCGDRFVWEKTILPGVREMMHALSPQKPTPQQLTLTKSSWDERPISERDLGIRMKKAST